MKNMNILKTFAVLGLSGALLFAASLCPAAEKAKTSKKKAPAKKEKTMATPEVQPELLANPQAATQKAPDVYKAQFSTTKGEFIIEVHRDWSPNGADRFYNLIKAGYYDNVAFFRVIDGFMVQFGINGSPEVNAKWREARIKDDPPAGQSNGRGAISFAMAGPNTRTTQVFVNYVNNSRLDSMGFTPFGKVVKGMETLDNLYKGYGEGAPSGMGPEQGRVQTEGNAYLKKDFPKLDYVKTARIGK
ncbi:MAG: peptidylprolyl isomerase [Elusimicrobiota bacterium]